MKNKLLLFSALMILSLGISKAQTARLQAIHNCPDPGAATVDVWIDATLLLDNFSFQEASSYIDAPTGTSFEVSICPSNSVDTTTAIFKKSFTLPMGSVTTVVAQGGLAQTGSTAFDLVPFSGQESSTMMGGVSVNIIHGSYDAPDVDIYEVQVPAGELVPDLAFNDQSGYTDLPATDFDIQVRTQAGVVVSEYDVDLSSFGDSAITVLASGYLDPASQPGTAPFGLIAVFPGGSVVSLPTKTTTPARLQVIHNCAATDASTVDVYLNDTRLIDDFNFRTAVGFIDAPAGVFFDVSIAGASSMDSAGALFRESFILESGKSYIVVASGTVGSGTYNPATPFSLEVIADARESATTAGNVDVLVWHGSTDAPMVDVFETFQQAGEIVPDLSYGESAGYLDLGATQYALEVRTQDGTVAAKYTADITGLADSAITILASGFLNPADNNNGPAFGLWVALPNGGSLIELGTITGIEENQNGISNLAIYPNPVLDNVNLTLEAIEGGTQDVRIFDLKGQLVFAEQLNLTKGQNNVELDVADLKAGNYLIVIGNDRLSAASKLIKQ